VLNKRFGADTEFNQNKHGYVLTFPWNFPEVIRDVEASYPVLP